MTCQNSGYWGTTPFGVLGKDHHAEFVLRRKQIHANMIYGIYW